MANAVPFSFETFFLSGYITFIIFLNILALLISLFYKKKINQPAPKAGFLIAIILASVYIALLYIPMNHTPALQIILSLSLFGSALASILSMLSLFLTMSKVRK